MSDKRLVTGPAHQQSVVPDDEELLGPLAEPLPPPQVAADAGLGGGPKTGLGGAPLDVVSPVLHGLLILVIVVAVRLVVAAF